MGSSEDAQSRCLDRQNAADKQVRWMDIGEKTQELIPNIEKKDHAKQVRMEEISYRIQELVPRIKKDRASDGRSIAERVRRTKISERLRNLQGLVPNMEKQTNTSDMLDMAVDYIKELQMKIKAMKEEEANCTCTCLPSKQKHSPADEAQPPVPGAKQADAG
ncbi:hypothetical protein CFC21_067212 [Triticum aestivum]|uniref:BHLH domain-containing protein n=2 Tax=Triticum aestivum TaxID=4565 RepID=A0A3B6KKH1_WHEAT|nr:hypothetical protein CFC21_067212 [Triticum aestivum]